MRIAIFGSAFNPPTIGHKDAIIYLLETDQVDKVLLVPSFAHAFGKDMLEYEVRLELLTAFVQDLDRPEVELLAIEHEICQASRPVYTYDLLRHLQENQFKDDTLAFVIGPDNLKNWHKFYQADSILENWQRIVVPERIAVRSTQVRNAIASAQSIEYLVTKRVKNTIIEHHLYLP